MTGPAPLDTTRPMMWFEENTASRIYLRTVDGVDRFTVTLGTPVESVRPEHLREVYCSDLLSAMKRIAWLMDNIVPGTWSRIPQTPPATECDPPVTG
jgi:hypothetical protein